MGATCFPRTPQDLRFDFCKMRVLPTIISCFSNLTCLSLRICRPDFNDRMPSLPGWLASLTGALAGGPAGGWAVGWVSGGARVGQGGPICRAQFPPGGMVPVLACLFLQAWLGWTHTARSQCGPPRPQPAWPHCLACSTWWVQAFGNQQACPTCCWVARCRPTPRAYCLHAGDGV